MNVAGEKMGLGNDTVEFNYAFALFVGGVLF